MIERDWLKWPGTRSVIRDSRSNCWGQEVSRNCSVGWESHLYGFEVGQLRLDGRTHPAVYLDQQLFRLLSHRLVAIFHQLLQHFHDRLHQDDLRTEIAAKIIIVVETRSGSFDSNPRWELGGNIGTFWAILWNGYREDCLISPRWDRLRLGLT